MGCFRNKPMGFIEKPSNEWSRSLPPGESSTVASVTETCSDQGGKYLISRLKGASQCHPSSFSCLNVGLTTVAGEMGTFEQRLQTLSFWRSRNMCQGYQDRATPVCQRTLMQRLSKGICWHLSEHLKDAAGPGKKVILSFLFNFKHSFGSNKQQPHDAQKEQIFSSGHQKEQRLF